MNKKNYKLLGIFVLLLVVVIGVSFYYFKFYKKNLEEQEYNSVSDSLFLRIKENPEYLVKENLLQIKSLSLMEFFRTKMLYHTYTNSSSPKQIFKEELEMDFPGERGKVLCEILEEYIDKEREKEKTLNDSDLDEYEKILKIEMLRIEFFGENLGALLFPPKDSEKIEKFYAYTSRYLKKHYKDLPRSKKNHISKARREIYSSEYERLYALEPTSRQFQLELKINERELSILNDYEKKQAIDTLKKNLGQTD